MGSIKKTFGSIGLYAIGSVVRQLVGFIMLPIYTTHLTPADYGIIGLLAVTVSVFELVLGARFAQSVPKFYYEVETTEQRNSVVSTALLFTVAASILAVGIAVTGSGQLSTLIAGDIKYQHYFAIYSILLLTLPIEYYGDTFLRLQEKPLLFFLSSISKLIIQVTLNVIFIVYYEMGIMGVVLSALISSSLFATMFGIYIFWHTGFIFNRQLALKLVKFSWPLWLAGFAMLYINSVNRYYIRIFSDLTEVGLFEFASKFAMLIPYLIWLPFSQWWQTERFKIYNNNEGSEKYPLIFNIITPLLFYAAIGICVLSTPVIIIMSNEAFHTASHAVSLLVLGATLGQLAIFFNVSFLVKDKTLNITYLRYTSAAIVTLLYFLFIPQYGFVGAGIAIALSESLVFFITYHYARKQYDMCVQLALFFKCLAVAILVVLLDVMFLNKMELLMQLIYKTVLLLATGTILFYLLWTDRYIRPHASLLSGYLKSRLRGN